MEGSEHERIAKTIVDVFSENHFNRLLSYELVIELDDIVEAGAWGTVSSRWWSMRISMM